MAISGSFALAEAVGSRSAPIFCFHGVVPEDAFDNIESTLPFFVPESIFERQIDLIQRRYQVITIDELVERQGRGKHLKRLAAVCFDDGYRNVYTTAYPILRKRGLPSTVFVVAGQVDSTRPVFGDKLKHLKACNPAFRKGQLDCVYREMELRKPLEVCEAALAQAFPESVSMTAERDSLNYAWLSGAEIREMAANGVCFGAHTVRHVVLPAQSPQKANEEILQSREILESIIGERVRGFCYPRGCFDQSTVAMVRAAGFSYACTSQRRRVGRTSDAFALPRISLASSTDPIVVRGKALGFGPVKYLRKIV